jgi:site-specific DNA recombinase
VAADYIRNLREETRKGFYGRLKQGLYPLGAPLGYLDMGGGKPKAIDPEKGPLVRSAFALYASGRYTLKNLAREMEKRGLRTRAGKPVSVTSLWQILRNPFYAGVIRLRKTEERFAGVHEPIVPIPLFERVEAILHGKTNARPVRHAFLFRRLFKCRHCCRSLIGESRKGHVYYRCHGADCPLSCHREENLAARVMTALARLEFTEEKAAALQDGLARVKAEWTERQAKEVQAIDLALAQVRSRLGRLTDAYLDQAVERDLFEERKNDLVSLRRKLEDRREALSSLQVEALSRVECFLDLARSASLLYEAGSPQGRRRLVEELTSNRTVDGKNVEVKLQSDYQVLADWQPVQSGAPERNGDGNTEMILRLLSMQPRHDLPPNNQPPLNWLR